VVARPARGGAALPRAAASRCGGGAVVVARCWRGGGAAPQWRAVPLPLPLHRAHARRGRRTSTRCPSRTTPSTTATRSRPAATRPTGAPPCPRGGQPRRGRGPLGLQRPPARARASTGRPAASARLGKVARTLWPAGRTGLRLHRPLLHRPPSTGRFLHPGAMSTARSCACSSPAAPLSRTSGAWCAAHPRTPSPARARRRAAALAAPRPAAAPRPPRRARRPRRASQRAACCCGADGQTRPEVRGAPVLEEDDRGGRWPPRHHPHQGGGPQP